MLGATRDLPTKGLSLSNQRTHDQIAGTCRNWHEHWQWRNPLNPEQNL
jgi:hypothetical protein